MDFSEALKCMKQEKKVTREEWNNKDVYVFLYRGVTAARKLMNNYITECIIDTRREDVLDIEIKMHPYPLKKCENGIHTPWICDNIDMLAIDWIEVE